MIKFRHKGDLSKTSKFLYKLHSKSFMKNIEIYAKEGVEALSENTPVLSGLTASSWTYRIVTNKDQLKIEWYNTNVVDYVNIAMIIQLGHGTRNGGYVEGIDYINPAMKPVFDKILDKTWAEVVKA